MKQLVDTVIGSRYRVKSLLGKQRGRRIFLAEDMADRTRVVLKLILFGPDFTWEDLKLFEREAETLKSLDHSAIPKYLDSFEVETELGKGFVLVQTYIEARSLQAWVSAGRTFGEGDLRAIATSLLNILTYLHQRQPPVIHRDIKPSNILLPGKGELTASSVYLVDFGSVQTAPSSGTMTVVGTYGYMPPEQFGGRAQPASDLYSLGATLIYLSTGQHPAELTQDNLQIAFEPPGNLSLSFAKWIQQLTYTDLSKRTASASQALAQLNDPSLVIQPVDVPVAVEPSSESGLSFQSAHKDFAITSSPSEFKVQFSPLRLPKPSASNGLLNISVIFWFFLSLVLINIGGLWFVVIAVMLWLMVTSSNRTQQNWKNAEVACLRLWELSEGALVLNLAVTSSRNGTGTISERLSDASVKRITAGRAGNSMIFDCECKGNVRRRMVITANPEDTRWLFKTLGRWTDGLRVKEKR